MALRFLRDHRPDVIGEIDDDAKLAAALIFIGLEKEGLVARSFESGIPSPIYRLTDAGAAAISASTHQNSEVA